MTKELKGDQKKSSQEKEYVVPPEGSLGLLALGAVGLRAWRKARLKASKNIKPTETK